MWNVDQTNIICKLFPPVTQQLYFLQYSVANVEPGAEIHTDEWKFYAGFNRQDFVHCSVNHSIQFVNPLNGAHTQSIECTGARAKKKYKRMHGTSKPLFGTYLINSCDARKSGKDTPFMNCITSCVPAL